jgi:predicted nucleic acid-binding protein
MAKVVVVDTSVLINFCHAERLDLFGGIERFEFVVPAEVDAEVVLPNQRALLEAAFKRRDIGRAATSDPDVLTRMAQFREQSLGLGEAACLAVAAARGWLVACDERRRFLRVAEATLGPGRVVDTAGLLLASIREGLISPREADSMKATLERHRFTMRFRSFEDLVG